MNDHTTALGEKLIRAATLLRDLGGEEEYDLADACEDAAQMIRARAIPRDLIFTVGAGTELDIESALGDLGRVRSYLADQDDRSTYEPGIVDGFVCDVDHVASLLRLISVPDSTTEAIEKLTDPSDRDDEPPPIGMVKDPLGTQDWPLADSEQLAAEDEDVVPPWLRDLVGPKDDAEKHRRRVALIGEVVKLRLEARERSRPLVDEEWSALEEAEGRLYPVSSGLNGWTDVVENEGDATLRAIWDQAKTYVEADGPDAHENAVREIAERAAAALSILAFGVGATDLTRLDTSAERG